MRRLIFERQERIAFGRRATQRADLAEKAEDENATEAGTNQDGEGEDIHGRVARKTKNRRDVSARLLILCAKIFMREKRGGNCIETIPDRCRR